MYTLEKKVDAEAAFVVEGPADHRTTMVIAKPLQRQRELLPRETHAEPLEPDPQRAQRPTKPLFHVPRGPLVGIATIAPLAGRGRCRGRGLGR